MSLRIRMAAKLLLLLCASVGLYALRASADEPTAFGRGALGGTSGLSLGNPETDVEEKPADLAMVVTAVELGGIERVDKQTVLNQIRIKPGMQLDPTAVADDQRRIWTMGLFDDVKVGLKMAGPHSVILRYQVLERPSIAAIEIVGNDAQSDDDVMKVVDLRVNNLYSPNDAAANIQKIKDLYVEEGYFLATVRHRTEPMPENQVKVIFEVQERAEVKVRQIDILGNEGVEDKDIKAVLRTQEGSILSAISKSGNFKRETLETDVQIMQYLYLTKGYIQAKIDDPVVSLSPDLRYISISIRVHEGPQFKVGKVLITGDSVEEQPVEKLKEKLQLKEGETFNYQFAQQDGQMLANAQKNYGYAHATASNESVPDPDKKTVDWTYHIQKGKKVYFGQISVRGGGSTRDKVVRRELLIGEGELYSEEKLTTSQARVQRLGYFEKVEIKTKPTALPQVVDVVVEVKERTTGTFQVGMGFSSLDNFIATAQISKDNFFGRGQRFSIQGSLSSIRTMFQASFFEPYFMDTKVTFSTDLFRYDQLYTDFTRRSKGGSMSWGYRLSDTVILEGGYQIEQAQTQIGGLSGRTDVPIASLFASGLTSALKATLSYDSRDDRMFPNTGWYITTTGEYALPALGSDNEFLRVVARVRRYVPLPAEAVLKFNLVGGWIHAPEGKIVPLFERFFIGGIYNVRGFVRNSLGPAIYIPTSSDPGATLSAFHNGGTKQLYLNNELEMPILKAPMNLRALLFFDIGNAFGEGESMTLANMRESIGWGIRWFSPVGPLRFEWGVPLNPRPGEQPLVFEFTIGNSF